MPRRSGSPQGVLGGVNFPVAAGFAAGFCDSCATADPAPAHHIRPAAIVIPADLRLSWVIRKLLAIRNGIISCYGGVGALVRRLLRTPLWLPPALSCFLSVVPPAL